MNAKSKLFLFVNKIVFFFNVLIIDGMLIHSSLYRHLGGLNTTLTENYASVDLCLRAGKHKKIIFGAKSTSIIYGDSGDSFSNKDELRSFSDTWSNELSSEIEGS